MASLIIYSKKAPFFSDQIVIDLMNEEFEPAAM